MKELYEAGKVRAIGVSNFQPDCVIDLMMFNKTPPAINQVETHPFYQQADNQLFLQENNIQIESWGPFVEGKNDIFKNKLLVALTKKYNQSVAQIILRWLTQRGVVVIPKSVYREIMSENFNVFDFELEADDMEIIKTFDIKTSLFFDHRNSEIIK